MEAPFPSVLRLVRHNLLPGLLQDLSSDDLVANRPEFPTESGRKIVKRPLDAVRKGIPKLI
jgi:hypothetical protein